MAWKIILVMLALPLIFIGYLYLNQRNMMYHPSGAYPDPAAYGADNAQIISVKTDDDLNLRGWYFPPRNDQSQVIVYFQGNAESYAARYSKLKPLIEQGYGVLFVGYRGYDGNEGKPTEQGLYKDAIAYMKALHQMYGVRLYDMVLYGESIGSGVAMQMGTKWEIGGIILESAFTTIPDVAAQTYGFLPLDRLMHDQYRNIDKAGRVDAPILVMHGKKDDLVPFAQGKELFKALLNQSASDQKIFIPFDDAGHVNVFDHGGQLHVEEFLRSIKQ